MARRKDVPLKTLSPSERVLFLKNFFTTGGTPPAYEQSARADIMTYLIGEEGLPPKAVARYLRRRWRHND